MKKTIAIILVIIAVVFCTCSSLFFGGPSFYASSSPAMAETITARGA
jgi:hypothetical protein